MSSNNNRVLGTFEKIFWVLDQKATLHFAMAAEIEGEIHPESWSIALKALQQRHPNLSVRIKGDSRLEPAFESVVGATISFRTVDLPHTENWTYVLEKEMAIPFELHQAPLVRLVLIRRPENTSILLFLTNHSIADGLSVAYAVRDLLHLVAGNVLPALPPTPPLDDLLGKTTSAVPDNQAHSQEIAQNLVSRNPVAIQTIQFDHQFTESIRRRARDEGATLHSALCAALVLAGQELAQAWREEPVRTLHPISVRNLFEDTEGYGLLFNIMIESYPLVHQRTFWEFARLIKKGMTDVKTAAWNKNTLTGVKAIFSRGMDYHELDKTLLSAFNHNLLLSNLGVIDYDTAIGNFNINNLWGPVILAPNPGAQTVGVVTTNGKLTATLTSHTPIEGLLTRAKQILLTACTLAAAD